jgi:hypothetical protein
MDMCRRKKVSLKKMYACRSIARHTAAPGCHLQIQNTKRLVAVQSERAHFETNKTGNVRIT